MSVYVLVLVRINEAEPRALARYLDMLFPLLASVGADIIERFLVNEVVGKARAGKTLMIVAFPNEDAVREVFGSKTYQNAQPLRDLAFEEYQISVVSNGSRR